MGPIGLVTLVASGIAGCGDDAVQLPPQAVAKVGDTVIDRSAYEKRLAIAAAYRLGRPPPYGLADYRRCAIFKQGQRPEGGTKPPSRASLVKQCKEEREEVKRQTMQSLVLAKWLDQEAAASHLRVSQKEIRNQLELLKRREFGSVEEYKQFLRGSKIPPSFFLEQARGRALTEKLMSRARRSAPPVTKAKVAAYYRGHPAEYRVPERRALHLIATKTRALALRAKQALREGRSWVAVARAYSLNPTAKEANLKVEFSRGGADKQLGDTIFGTPKGVIGGPAKTAGGWLIFRTDKVLPASRSPLTAVTPQIKSKLTQDGEQRALDTYTKAFGARFQAKTTCADDYKIQECKNGPTTRPGTAAQTAPPAGAGNANQ